VRPRAPPHPNSAHSVTKCKELLHIAIFRVLGPWYSDMMTLPTGNLLRAARALADLTATELAKLARIDASTISRMESAGNKPVRGQAGTVDAVLRALKARGVEIDSEDGVVRLAKKPRREQLRALLGAGKPRH